MHAMEQEMGNMADFGVWELVPVLGQESHVVQVGLHSQAQHDGGVDRLKARLTCRGFTRKAGIDYDDT